MPVPFSSLEFSPFSLMLFCLLNAQSFLQKRLNEEIIDYDLLEDLICYVDETCGEGAILIFLPVSLFNIFLSSTTEWSVLFSSRTVILIQFVLYNRACLKFTCYSIGWLLLIDLEDHLLIGFFLCIHL